MTNRNPRGRVRSGTLFALTALLCLGLSFLGCNPDPPPDDPIVATILDELVGKWLSSFSEEFEISKTKFISGWGGDVGYEGPIVNVRNDGDGAGYITIRYTANTYTPAAVGNYYVIRWENLTSTSVSLTGASDGAGKGTQAEAEDEYTVAGGYFAWFSDCTKVEEF
jgi:hypothetical protein